VRIVVITPAPRGSRRGNRITALRWAHLLRELGHRVQVATDWRGQPCDVLVAIHAGHCAEAVARFRAARPGAPLIVGLAGTDVYRDILTQGAAQLSLELASCLIALEPLGLNELPPALQPRARVLFQSARPPRGRFRPRDGVFEVCVMSHLRAVKDPLRAAHAARLLPADSRIRVVHLGGVLDPALAHEARAEAAANPRYQWLGELPRWQALRVLARSKLLVLSSLLEGGANVISEAIATGVPVVSSHIPGSAGILGRDYPGYFPVGDSKALAGLLHRAEADPGFYQNLQAWCARLAPLIHPVRERAGWKALLAEVTAPGAAAWRGGHTIAERG
jgi:putative glycosyltransferase (TIGR04348 family)